LVAIGGLDFADAQNVVVDATFDAWVVPGSALICIYHVMPEGLNGVTCNTPANAAAGRFTSINIAPGGQQTVFGLVPDGAAAPTVTLADGTVQPAALTDNVFAYTAAAGTSIASVATTVAGAQVIARGFPTSASLNAGANGG
jgi:hypothetical protein